MTKKYFILGVGYKKDDTDRKYPYEVWLDLQEPKFPIVMLEGSGAGGVGGNFRPSELLKTHWKEHLEISGVGWLIPLCKEALVNSDMLDSDLVVDTYKYHNNCEPDLKVI